MALSEIDAGTQLSFDPGEEIVYGFARDLSG